MLLLNTFSPIKQDEKNEIIWHHLCFLCSIVKFVVSHYFIIRKKSWSWHIDILIVIHSGPVTGVGGSDLRMLLCPESYWQVPIRQMGWWYFLGTISGEHSVINKNISVYRVELGKGLGEKFPGSWNHNTTLSDFSDLQRLGPWSTTGPGWKGLLREQGTQNS